MARQELAPDFPDLLGRYVARAGYTPGQLARLTGVPKMTIVNWLDGRVRRPRQPAPLLSLMAVLHLDPAEADALLHAAGQPTLAALRHLPAAPALLRPWDAPAAPAPREPPFQAIADLPTFVGRQAELDALKADLLGDQPAALYTISGMAGVGKTTLAARLAYELRPHFPDGVLWARVDLADTLSILSTFAAAYAVDVSPYPGVESRSRVVRDLLAHKKALIILDNVERSQAVQPLLPPTGRCAVLLTTRRRDLAVARGARRLQLGPFDDGRGESQALFARILSPDRAAREAAPLRHIAHLLGHLPLAVDIAAGRLAYEPGWTAAAFLDRIRQHGRRLGELDSDDQSVRLSFQASFSALPPAWQATFAALGLFRGEDFSPEAAAHVAALDLASAENRLRRLHALCLVRQGRPGRYRLHPLLADYALEQLPDDERPPLLRRLVDYYAAFVAARPRHFAALELEQGNLLAALDAAHDLALDEALLRGAAGLYPYLEGRGLYELAQRHLERARAAAARLGRRAGSGRLACLYYLGRLAERRGDYAAAEALFEQGLLPPGRPPAGQEQLYVELKSHLLRGLGLLAARRGDYGLAEAYYREGLTLARRLSAGGAVSSFIRGLGVQAYMRGDYAEAETMLEEGLALAHLEQEQPASSSPAGYEDLLHWGMGQVAREQDDLEQAERYFRQGLILARQSGHRERTILLLRELGLLAAGQGQYGPAESYLLEALAAAGDIGHRWHLYGALSLLGEVRLEQGLWAAAVDTFREIRRLGETADSQEMHATALYGLARAAASQGDPAAARDLAGRSLDLFTAIGHFRAADVRAWLTRKDEGVN